MAEQNPPPYVTGQCYTAQQDRLVLGSLVCGGGVVGASSGALAVMQPDTTVLSVDVAPGSAFIEGTNVSGQGVYHVYNDAPVTLAVTPPDPTDPRADIVVATVRDSQYSGTDNDWLLQVIEGVPSPTPAAPELPDNSILLATLRVSPNSTQIAVTDERENYTSCSNEISSVTPAGTNSAYTGEITAYRHGGMITYNGTIYRNSGFNPESHSSGIVFPAGWRSAVNQYTPTYPVWGTSTAEYRFRVLTNGTIEVQESAAFNSGMILNFTLPAGD